MSNWIKNLSRLGIIIFLFPFICQGQGIVISSGGKFLVSGAATISITDGGFTNNGTYTKGSETFSFLGTAADSVAGNSTVFHNLVISNSGGIQTKINLLTANDLSVVSGGVFTVPAGKGVTVKNAFSNSGTFQINSDAASSGSLIIEGTSTGNISYNRYLTADQWHIAGLPVSGQGIQDLLTNGNNSIAFKNNQYGITTYNEALNDWNAYFTAATSGDFENGTGYLFRRETASGGVYFTGAAVSGTVTVPVTLAGAGYGWNCIGNPYTSAIGANSNAVSVSNFLATNEGILDDSYEALYFWNQTVNGGVGNYEIVNNTSAAGYVQSGQGFIVRASGNGNVSFSPYMQTHQTTQEYKSAEIPWPKLVLQAIQNEDTVSTTLLFHENMTRGLDPGYDAGIFKQDENFNLYTQLVEDNGVEFNLQCLPDEYESLDIPVGMDVRQGGEITFRMELTAFNTSFSPVLNDYLTGSKIVFTSENEFYKATVPVQTLGFGRFFLSFASVATATEDFSNPEIFKGWFDNGKIYLRGNASGTESASLYDISGKIILQQQLRKGNTHVMELPVRQNGIYFIKIEKTNAAEVLKIPVFLNR